MAAQDPLRLRLTDTEARHYITALAAHHGMARFADAYLNAAQDWTVIRLPCGARMERSIYHGCWLLVMP